MDNVVGSEGTAIFDGRTSNALTITHQVLTAVHTKAIIEVTTLYQEIPSKLRSKKSSHFKWISMKTRIIIAFDQNQNGNGRCALELEAAMI